MMRKQISKILAIASLFALAGCKNNDTLPRGSVLPTEEAKSQIQAMSEKVYSDDFVLPTKGTIKVKNEFKYTNSNLETSFETRFNLEKGSRYVYYSMPNNVACIYEKDGTYHYYIENYLTEEKQTGTYSSEEEFETAFTKYGEMSGSLEANLKTTITSPYTTISAAYDGLTNTDNITGYKTVFEKYDDSSFKFDASYNQYDPNTQSNFIMSTTIVVESYLLRTVTGTIEAKKDNQSEKIISTATYSWGTLEYIYPGE